MRNLKIRAAVLLTLLLLGGVMLVPGVLAKPTHASSLINVPVSGNAPGGKSFVGELDITQFRVDGNKIVADGIISGTLTDKSGNVIDTVTSEQVFDIPVKLQLQQSTCQILYLTLGPIHLELLGLNIDISRIVISITADPSEGLLGQLLCSLAGGNNTLQGIVDLLNQILDLLN